MKMKEIELRGTHASLVPLWIRHCFALMNQGAGMPALGPISLIFLQFTWEKNGQIKGW